MFAKEGEESVTDGLTHRLEDPRAVHNQKPVSIRSFPIALDEWMQPKQGEDTVRDSSAHRSVSP